MTSRSDMIESVSKVIVFYSGGISSFVAAKLAIEKYGTEKTELVFTDTKTEDEDLYRFLKESADALSAKLKVLADGRDVWQVFSDVRFVGNSKVDPCSQYLKRKVAKKYVNETCDESALLVFGIDEFETHRIPAIEKNYLPRRCWFPLTETIIGYSQRFEILRRLNIRPPRLYELGFSHNNCGGFCVKAGQAHFANLYRTMPERYNYHAQKELAAIKSGINHKGIIRVTNNNQKRYMTLEEFKEHIESSLFDAHDVRGCGCFYED